MNVGESGVRFLIGVGYDMSAYTGLSITFTKPDGEELTVTNPEVSISASPVVTTEGTFAANTYGIYIFEDGDVDQDGLWSARLTYDDNASPVPQHLISDVATFTINP